MQKYDESFDRYVPQPFRGTVPKASEHEPIDRDSQQFVHKTKNLFESMDFEEMESVMWRKVSYRTHPDYFLPMNALSGSIFYHCSCFSTRTIRSTNLGGFSKIEEPGGQTHAERLLENGCW